MANQVHLKPLSNREIASFCGQIAMILGAGISAAEGIAIMSDEAESKEESTILERINQSLSENGIFAEALRQSGVFPDYMLNMVEIGETSGKLDEVMASLSEHYEREDNIAAAIKNAVTYPFIMVVMMTLVIVVLVVKVLPVFNQVFKQLGREMSGVSKGIMNFGMILSRYSLVFIAVLVILAALFVFFTSTKKGRAIFSSLGYSLGIARGLSNKTAACRFASGMALTLSSGLNPDEGMELSEALVENPAYRGKVTACRNLVKEGKDISAALYESGVFSGIYAKMVSVGFRTGSLEEVMRKISIQYEEEIDMKISNVIAVLEPTLVAILSIIVGVILLSVMLPLMGMMAGF